MSAITPEDSSKNNRNPDVSQDEYEAVYDDVDLSDQESDEWADDQQSDMDEDKNQAPIKKKKSKLTIFIIVGIVLLAFIGFIMVSGGGQNQAVVAQQTVEPTVINAENVNTSSPPVDQTQPIVPAVDNQIKPVKEQTGMMDDEAVVKKMENVVEVAPTPPALDANAPIENTAEITPAPASEIESPKDNSLMGQESNNSLVKAVTPDIKTVSDFPTADAIKKPEAVQANLTPVVASPEEIKENTNELAEKEAKISEIQDKLNSAEARITDLEKTISEKDEELSKQKMAAPVLDNSNNNEEILSLKSKISQLEKKIAESTQDNQEQLIIANKPIENREKAKSDLVSKNTVSVPKVLPHQLKPVWVLKGASATKAIIYNKVSGDSKTITVGDVVDGLGRILSITEKNSLWVVKASKANLSE